MTDKSSIDSRVCCREEAQHSFDCAQDGLRAYNRKKLLWRSFAGDLGEGVGDDAGAFFDGDDVV
jgi:hypothetical protein